MTNMHKVCLLVQCFALIVYGALGCVDDDEALETFMEDNGGSIQYCADLGNLCFHETYGPVLAQFCNCTCGGSISAPDLPPPDPNNPVQLVLLSGQSECQGQAQRNDLEADLNYEELHGDISNAWLAELNESRNMVISSMNARNGNSAFLFGPELSFAQRFQNATGKRILVIKYCWGGTGVHDNWSPDTTANRWNYTKDDGSAEWLLQNGVDLQSNLNAFVNAIYVVRLTIEALEDANIDYEWSSILWLQGKGDSIQGNGTAFEAGWQLFGQNTARLFDMFREYAAKTWDLPIIDEGANGALTLRTGKAIAHQTTKGCNVGYLPNLVLTYKSGSVCEPGIEPPVGVNCNDSAILRPDAYDYYGYDPNTPPGNWNKTFAWFVSATNQHSAYEGMILKGRTMANIYLKEFYKRKNPEWPGLTDEMKLDDASELFPVPRCMPGEIPSVTNFCWSDLRNEEEAAKECIPQPPDSESATPTIASPTVSPVVDSSAIRLTHTLSMLTIFQLWMLFAPY